jgi:hypothetical protein
VPFDMQNIIAKLEQLKRQQQQNQQQPENPANWSMDSIWKMPKLEVFLLTILNF